MISKQSDANFPTAADGRVYHVGVKPGEVANRIITVGEAHRARVLAEHLDPSPPPFIHESIRGFLTITGTYRNVPVSIIAIGMGFAMMDMFVRETRAVVDGEMVVVRFGSCGTLGSVPLGSMIVPTGAFAVTSKFDHLLPDEKLGPESSYNLSGICEVDSELNELLQSELVKTLGASQIFTGLNATCDSFYSSQGRNDPNFQDNNKDLLAHIKSKYPNAQSLEMETFMLLHLAQLTTNKGKIEGHKNSIRAAAIHMVITDRLRNEFIAPERMQFLEETAGTAALETVVKVQLNK